MIEITGGPVSGRRATTGVPSPPVPGYIFQIGGPDGYQLFGIPAGMYELTVRADGYLPQSRVVTVTPPFTPDAHFELVRAGQ